jgi:hypothetical protein
MECKNIHMATREFYNRVTPKLSTPPEVDTRGRNASKPANFPQVGLDGTSNMRQCGSSASAFGRNP